MKKILLLGAGRSATSLIDYLKRYAVDSEVTVTVGDITRELAEEKCKGTECLIPLGLDINNEELRKGLIAESDIVISLLPASLHILVARDCVQIGVSLVTASYVSDEINELDSVAKEKGVLLLNEIGLDPGIDHLSAMQIIHKIQQSGGVIKSFKSYTGGLVAPESNDNPWSYKFTWNPRNVVLAGKGRAEFLQKGERLGVAYEELFNTVEKISVDGYGDFEGYPNRDSLKYIEAYGLSNLETMIRGTLRYPGFCEAWNAIVHMGLTAERGLDHIPANNLEWLKSVIGVGNPDVYFKENFSSEVVKKLEWLGLLEDEEISSSVNSSADILQNILESKWVLATNDIDMIVMQHQFISINREGVEENINSTLVVKGDDQTHTAMAKTVGLPVGIASRLILEGKINDSGVVIPLSKGYYEPILKELDGLGISFTETVS